MSREREKRESEKIPTSRARRTATVATLAASEAVKQFGTRAANVTRGEEASEQAMARRQLETAKQIVAVLGTMKGAAMKLGQVMSFLDVGLVAEEHREEFQRELAKLRDSAPTVSFKQMRRVIEDDLEEPISEVFASFQEEPIAAASIGQVYKASLVEDGRDVAVKVQYPGVAGAVRADLQNLDMILRLLKRMTPGLDVKAIAEEIRERIGEELDYELEAQNQRSLARIFAGHPFIVVPEVVTALSRERVLVSDFVEGVGFEELKARPQAERDRLGEIVFRFFLGCLYRHRQFSGDPHPGNFLLQNDGRVAFLDFGLFKRMDAAAVELELACQRAVVEGDAATLHALLAASGFLPEPERVDADHLLAFIEDAIWWYTTADEQVQLSPEIATQVMIE
ncbi:MAG: AarF/ABC1/UbiB kinase family protein, partial [Actinomycetota bacterium]|nr:AarF/ABC1/UbiB kinase family protein [Actinomycetota bacterium]